MNDLEKQVLELVKRDMSATQAKAMKELMSEYQDLKRENPTLTKYIEELEETNLHFSKTIKGLESDVTRLNIIVDSIQSDMDSNVKERRLIEKIQSDHSLQVIKQQLIAYQEADKKIDNFFNLVFRNTVVNKTYTENISNGGASSSRYCSEHTSENIT